MTQNYCLPFNMSQNNFTLLDFINVNFKMADKDKFLLFEWFNDCNFIKMCDFCLKK